MEASPHQDVRLPESVELSIERIRQEKDQPPLKTYARKMLAEIGEQASVDVLNSILSSNKEITSFSGYVSFLVKKDFPIQAAAVLSVYQSPQASPQTQRMWSPSSTSPCNSPHTPNGESLQSPLSSFPVNCSSPNLQRTASKKISCQLSFEDETQEKRNPSVRGKSSHARELGEMADSMTIRLILNKLEYRKLFLVLSYIGRQKLEAVVTLDGANEVYSMKDLPMKVFETEIWNKYGQKFCDESDRSQYLDWDSGTTHNYCSHVCQDGSYYFKHYMEPNSSGSGGGDSSNDSFRKDPCWKYVHMLNPPKTNDFVCNFCNKVTKGGIYRAKQHLMGGSQNAKTCPRCPSHVREEIGNHVMQKTLLNKEKCGLSDFEDVDTYGDDVELDDIGAKKSSIEESRNKSVNMRKKPRQKGPMDVYFARDPEKDVQNRRDKNLRQSTINEACKKELRDKACRDIARWMYDAAIPFNAVNYPSFEVMIESIGQYGVGLKPPSYHEIRVPLLKKEVGAVTDMMKSYEEEWAKYGCSLMADGWTDKRQRTLINFLVNSPKGTFFLESIDASDYSKTGEKLFQLFDGFIERIGEANVIQVITDNAASNVLAGQLLEAKRKHLYWTPCAAHCIDLMLEDIGKLPNFTRTLKRAMSLNAYIYVRPGVVNLLRHFTGHKELVRAGVTRFATAFLTLHRIHKQKNNLRKMFTSDEWATSKWAKEAGGKQTATTILMPSFWNNIIYMLKIFGPLVRVLRLVDGEKKPAMGYIYKAMDRAKENIMKAFHGKEEKYKEIFTIIDKRWESQLHRPLHAAGFFLNPEFFYSSEDLSPCEEVMDGFVQAVQRLIPNIEEQDKIMDQISLYQNAEGLFGRELAIRHRTTKAPADWWKIYGSSTPNLQRFAIKILSLTCSASGCERNWSIFEHGPYLNSSRTHLQRSLGDDNILMVKFLEDGAYATGKIVEGILVGLRRYRFFVFKDARKKLKKNQIVEDKIATYSAVKCYFVHIDSVSPHGHDENYILSRKTISEARRLFMHIHTVPTLEKYMARFSLILSKTRKLEVNFAAVIVEIIKDIPFQDENGSIIHDEDGKPILHTDGTGYISEDLAMKCPKDFYASKYTTDSSFEKYDQFAKFEDIAFQERGAGTRNMELPLLMQCRLFHDGYAVKGTLLVNRKLEPGIIQIRPSMIKVEKDQVQTSQMTETFNSLEIVTTSHRPGRNCLSKYLIALLSYGGVPQEFFLNLLTNALEETRNVYSSRRAALRVASNHDGLDFGFVAQRMISSGVPLNEPYLQLCLSNLASNEKTKLKEGKIPVSESFYLMGTADPTGVLNNDEVCVILDSGQISGKVLVYRNPGMHFGDVHIMEAVYVKELEEVVGNAKYGIFFSIKGKKSAAYEMATGDFDGDKYWVSRNPELLKYFKANEPWRRIYSVPDSKKRNPQEFSDLELERELFQLFLEATRPSFSMSTAADSWLTFMDRLLTLGDDRANEKHSLKRKMIKLVDIYYDALDAPKSGKKVKVPEDLRAAMFPHHMEKGPDLSYQSSSVLGQIHDRVQAFKNEAVPKKEIWKLPCFDVLIPEIYVSMWKARYENYRKEMAKALKSSDESKNDAADEVISKYKQLLYEAPDMEESAKNTEVIYEEAIAIYHVTYDYAMSHGVEKCGFAWRVAASALCNLCAWKLAGPKEKPLTILPSVLRELLN